MISEMKQIISLFLEDIKDVTDDIIEDLFIQALKDISGFIEKKYKIKLKVSIPEKIKLEKISEELEVDIGLKYQGELILSEWLLEEQFRSKQCVLCWR